MKKRAVDKTPKVLPAKPLLAKPTRTPRGQVLKVAALTPLQIQKQRRAEQLKQRNDAAARIQRQWRKYLKSDALSLKRRTVVCAIVIQRMWRNYVRRRNKHLKARFEEWLTARHRNATHKWQFAVHRDMMYIQWARQKICTTIFAYYLRRKLLRRRQERMAVVIQREVRSYLHRKHSQYLIDFAHEQRDFLRYWKVCDATLTKEECAKRSELCHRINKMLGAAKLAQVQRWQEAVGWRPVASRSISVMKETEEEKEEGQSSRCGLRPSSTLPRCPPSSQLGECRQEPQASTFSVAIPRRPNSAAMRRRPF